METTREERFNFAHANFDAPIVVSNASSIASPITGPRLKGKMALSQSTTSIVSDTSSIFALESDVRCMTLRQKRQDVRVLFEKWESDYKRYAVFSQEEIQASDDIFEAVTDLDTERAQVCFAILDFAH